MYALFALVPVPVKQPTYSIANARVQFWADLNPVFGVWHPPRVRYQHAKSCFNVIYRSNAYGARDRERARHASEKRVLVLGDSFIEGLGVERAQRLSDRLERDTGIPHLNFGTAGNFGSTQYLLLYKTLVKSFSHNAVMVGVLPDNDFSDDDLSAHKHHTPDRYRPYLRGKYPHYRLVYTPGRLGLINHAWPMRTRRLLQEFSYTANVIPRLTRLFHPRYRPKGYAGYYDFNQAQLERLQYALRRIKSEAEGRSVTVFTIPRANDFARFGTAGSAPLPKRLETFCEQHGIRYVDLMPSMLGHTTNWAHYFLACDGHWSAAGHETAAAVLLKTLYAQRRSE